MLRRALLSLLASSLLLACSDAVGPSERVAGAWRLQTVNGLTLPYTLSETGTFKEALTGEVITLLAPGSLTIVTEFRYTEGGIVSTESVPDGGTYAVNGSTATMTWASDGSTSTATVSGDTMTTWTSASRSSLVAPDAAA